MWDFCSEEEMTRVYGWYLVRFAHSYEDEIFDNGWKKLGTYGKSTYYHIAEWCKNESEGYWDYSPSRYSESVPNEFFEVIRRIENIPENTKEEISKEEHERFKADRNRFEYLY